MGFAIEYLSDGTVKGTLDLKGEDVDFRCVQKSLPEPPAEEKKPAAAPTVEAAKASDEFPIVETKPLVREKRESSST